MIRSNLGAGYALVPVPLDANNYVSRTSGSNVLPAHAGEIVNRTPHLVAYEPEPGAGWPGGLANKMWLPDGRLVDANSSTKDMFQGALGGFGDTIRSVVPALGAAAGGILGFKYSPSQRGWGALTGAVVGGVLGLIFR